MQDLCSFPDGFRSAPSLPLARAQLPFTWQISRHSGCEVHSCRGLVTAPVLALVSAATLKMSSYTIEVVPFASYDWTFEKAGWLNLK